MLCSKSLIFYEPNPVKGMAWRPLIQFPVSAPTPTSPAHRHPATEIRFSRWNNANAEKFNREKRTQKEIEDQRRFEKRYDSALNIAHSYNPAPPTPTFKSTGTPSSPSKPSIPGKKSKYSKPPQNSIDLHPAFRPLLNQRRFPMKNAARTSFDENVENGSKIQEEGTANVKIDDNGLSYEFPDAPFVYQYSYTEAPKVKPVGIREPLVAPFEPDTMGRPWTGRKPLPPSKKKLPEFDSFKLPPPNKKGVKSVQAPGPYLPGSGPKYVRSREEVLGEPLTKEEITELVESCKKSKRQLNMGRDGFTHNMLNNIHAHWKRRRVCKIKCKGVCTVDMDNVRKHLEDKTGGQVIYSRGGVVYLFRGRNYNYKSRPRFPLMLWKPVSPVYPRLIKQVPDGLTLEEATEMRKKGRNLAPICKLAKNGVYCDLVKNVREAFEACELVRINCQGLNGSDYRKIGAKLKDHVPGVLISFENEHILMWRGRDWKSTIAEPETVADRAKELDADDATCSGPTVKSQVGLLAAASSTVTNSMALTTSTEEIDGKSDSSRVENGEHVGYSVHGKGVIGDHTASVDSEALSVGCEIDPSEHTPSQFKKLETDAATYVRPTLDGETEPFAASASAITNSVATGTMNVDVDTKSVEPQGSINHGQEEAVELSMDSDTLSASDSDSLEEINGSKEVCDSSNTFLNDTGSLSSRSETMHVENDDLLLEPLAVLPLTANKSEEVSEEKKVVIESSSSVAPALAGVHLLLKMAVENGSAIILEDSSLDADIVCEKAAALAKSAPPGPVFRHGLRKSVVQGCDEQPKGDLAGKEDVKASDHKLTISSKRGTGKKSSKKRQSDIQGALLNVAPQGSLRVDELAKLLA